MLQHVLQGDVSRKLEHLALACFFLIGWSQLMLIIKELAENDVSWLPLVGLDPAMDDQKGTGYLDELDPAIEALTVWKS